MVSCTRWRRRCRGQRRRSRRWTVTSPRVRRSESRRGIASRTTTCRYTICAKGAVGALYKDVETTCPVSRPRVLCRKEVCPPIEVQVLQEAPPFVVVF